MRSPRPPARIASATPDSFMALILRLRLSAGHFQVSLSSLPVLIWIHVEIRCVALGRVVVLFGIHLFPPRLVFATEPAMNFPQHRHAPPASRAGRETLRDLRGRLRLFHLAEVLDLPQGNVKAEADRVIGLEGHALIVSG